MEAVLYSRWSSLEQKGTTSAQRQLEITEALARRNGWPVVSRLVDSGKSAWTGDNLTTGALGIFAEQCQRQGGIGKVLVVEKLDRLSRQKPRVMARWIETIVLTGLTIMTADGRHTIDEKALDNPMIYMTMIFEGFRGYEESETKSIRVAEANRLKRERGAPMTRNCPGWLTIDARDTCYKSPTNVAAKHTEIPERVAVVRRIFDMTDAKKGKSAIANTLNIERVPVFGRGKCWHASYVQKILRNPAVIGEAQFCTKPKGGVRSPVGEVRPNYYPAIISIEQFERVNDKRALRLLAQKGSGEKLVNLLSGFTACTHCGGPMTLLSRGTETLTNGDKIARRYLRCSSAHRSLGCKNRVTFEYSQVERVLLDTVLHLAMDDQHFAREAEISEIETALTLARRALAGAVRKKEIAYKAMEEDADDELASRRYRQRRDEAKVAKADVDRLYALSRTANGAVSPAEHVRRVVEVREMMSSNDADERFAARSLVKLALNDLINVVSFSGRKNRWTVRMANNSRSITFSRLYGEFCFELDWLELRREWVDTSGEVMDGYLRRRDTSGTP